MAGILEAEASTTSSGGTIEKSRRSLISQLELAASEKRSSCATGAGTGG